eukprot:9423043-Lingulodinium_polyedra.AAC.1
MSRGPPAEGLAMRGAASRPAAHPRPAARAVREALGQVAPVGCTGSKPGGPEEQAEAAQPRPRR